MQLSESTNQQAEFMNLNIVEPVPQHIDQEDISDDDEGKNRSLSQDDADFHFDSKEDSVYDFAAEDDAFDAYLKEKNMDGVYEELGIASDLGDNDEAAERKRGK
ncbi:unnamed protein product [Alternaria alternata]